MKVGDLVDAGYAEIKTGPFGTQLRASDYVDAGRPVLNVRNVGFGDVRPKDLEFVDEATASRLSSHLLKPKDIVFGRKGAVERHAFIPEKYDGAMQGSDCIRLRVSDDSPITAQFLTFALRTKQHQAWMRAFCSHGATMASLNQDIVRQIPLPQIDQAGQDLAVAVLRNIDNLIENNRRRVEVLEEMARAIYCEWFVKFRYPGHEDVRLVDAALGPIPEGWTVHPFAEVASFVNGFAFKPSHWGEEGRPIIKIKELKQGVTQATPRHPAKFIAPKYWVERGDLLFSWSADLGVYLWDSEPGLLNQHLFTVRPEHPGLTIGFLYHSLSQAMPQFRARAQGTTMRHIKRSALTEVEMVLPPGELMDRFTRDVEPFHEEVARLRQEAVALEALRDLLLPKLVTGQIDVSALDLDVRMAEAVAL